MCVCVMYIAYYAVYTQPHTFINNYYIININNINKRRLTKSVLNILIFENATT